MVPMRLHWSLRIPCSLCHSMGEGNVVHHFLPLEYIKSDYVKRSKSVSKDSYCEAEGQGSCSEWLGMYNIDTHKWAILLACHDDLKL